MCDQTIRPNLAAMDMKSTPVKSLNHPHLRRWNSISPCVTTATARSSPSATFASSDDLELLPMKAASHFHSYSSLRDLLPAVAAVNSPMLKSTPPGSDICIRNRLVKQAARAYLSPMSAYPSSTGGSFFHRLWTGVAAFVDFFCREVVRILDGVRIRSSGFRMCSV